MRTKEEISTIIAKQLFPKLLQESTFSDLAQSISALSNVEKDTLIHAIVHERYEDVGKFLSGILTDVAKEKSRVEAEQMLVDDSLDLTEIDRILE